MFASLTTEEQRLLGASPLFAGLTARELVEGIEILQARRRSFAKGEFIQHIGEPFRYAGIVLSGAVECSFTTEAFNRISVRHLETGELFGETLAWARVQKSPMQVTALQDSTVLLFSIEALKAETLSPVAVKIGRNLVGVLVSINLHLNRRVRVLGQGSIRDRLRVFLAESETGPDGFVRLPFSYTELAGILGVNRSALSREIGRMRDEGLLDTGGQALRLRRG
ncbi:MAG: Crp/Fnr family transcriptional regulator [Eggerthellaceae bacterium]|nr:Crp/Fnr family transcriptional regulator [Eggerthellaceae bacterium]